MLGLGSLGSFLAYVLTILAGLLCIGWGLVMWNKPVRPDASRARKIIEKPTSGT